LGLHPLWSNKFLAPLPENVSRTLSLISVIFILLLIFFLF